jgi:hypothetical protein
LKLRARIMILFFQCDCNDEEILFFLKQEKYFINRWELIRIRKELDITKRIFVRDKKESNQILLNIVKTKLDKDVAREYEKCQNFDSSELLRIRSLIWSS